MTEHTKTDGLPGMDLPVVPESAGLGKAPLRNDRMSAAKVECNACPVLCQISDGRTGACDRYANRDGVLVRVDPVVLLRRELKHPSPALVPFARDGAEPAAEGAQAAETDWNGDLLHAPGLSRGEAKRLKGLQQRLARAKRGSHRRARTKRAIAKLKAREKDRRKDWVEKVTTDIARRFDTIRIEALDVRAMTRTARGTVEQPGVRVAQKRGLNRGIRRSGWGLLATRLQHKACGRVEQVPAAYTSQRCSVCGHVAPDNRKSQAVFQCEACNAGPCHADVNAACNIAAGRAVTARGDLGASRSANREPQLCSPAA
jgi:putative transposase